MAGRRGSRDVLKLFHERYRKAKGLEKTRVLDEFCDATGYHRKYAITLLNRPWEQLKTARPRRRGPSYSAHAIRVIEHIWKTAGYPWSERLKALLPRWLPWAHKHLGKIPPDVEREILSISPRQIDRRLQPKKRQLGRRLYGHTKPGTLLKHQIPIKTDNWDIHEPGFAEIDLVSHSGPCASGEFIYSLNLTDIHTGWGETRAVIGKGETGVVDALDEIRRALPFRLKGIDSDNGSEFINHHLVRYCKKHQVQFTRGRPYKKDDNAHVEQKNWTHVRKLFGWDRYDSPAVLEAMNELYRHELPAMMNQFQPSVKLASKERIGSRVRRRYDAPQTPLDRLVGYYEEGKVPLPLRRLVQQRDRQDPFSLSESIEVQLVAIEQQRRDGHSVLLQQHPSPRGGVLHKASKASHG